MKVLGIEFAPLAVPLHRRIETVAAAAWFFTFAFGGFVAMYFTAHLIFFTRFWWLTLLYLAWVYTDRHIHEKGGRPNQWVRKWAWWYYFTNYFPVNLKCASKTELDPKRNYLFCCFPHGMLPAGVFGSFGSDHSSYRQLFPHHEPRVVTLTQHYLIPFFRELALSLCGIGASAAAIAHVLAHPGGGRVVALMPGGAAEAYYCKPGQYKILLRKRKGFIKVALKTGAPLVPVISFGETDLFTQVEGSTLRKIQETIRGYVGMAPIFPIGRGFFQYSFGMIPKRKSVTTVVGTPIEVEKVANPTNEEIEKLHQLFCGELTKLFEEQKHLCLKNSEDIKLEIL